MFPQDRTTLRQMYAEAWRKHVAREPLDPLQAAIADVVALHPEYHATISGDESTLDRDYSPESGETNPFLHLGLHLGIREQIGTNRPAGIREVHQQLVTRCGDPHEAEHQIMECLAEAIWSAQRNNTTPDEQVYLSRLRELLN